MNHHVLTARSTYLRSIHRCWYHVGRAGSVNSSIERNLRKFSPEKSKSKPWETKRFENRSPDFPNERRDPSRSFQNRDSEGFSRKRDFSDRESPGFKGPRRETSPPGRSSHFMKRHQEGNPSGRSSNYGNQTRGEDSARRNSDYQSTRRGGNAERPSSDGQNRRSVRSEYQRPSNGSDRPSHFSNGRSSASSYPRKDRFQNNEDSTNATQHRASPARDRDGKAPIRYNTSPSNPEIYGFRPDQRQENMVSPRTSILNRSKSEHPPVEKSRSTDKLPVSIPYTTPASEFLYGTSVIMGALTSQRLPRRKLYKLYIYNGQNREVGERDEQVERIAYKNRVPVVRVGNEGLRLLDKLSAGRPHNGYILEASPLPRLPVESLGPQIVKDGQNGYSVVVGYQSREEADVNGTTDFQPIKSPFGKMPLVLLLDGIRDPGNLGGILRTAQFLGVSAVAISARNSASFTPVVLKASAGASENVSLFSISSPANFLIESQRAGWKVFAAVAPSFDAKTMSSKSVSTDDIGNPLQESPCILALGSEGEGLRWQVRSKADVELYIPGEASSTDSLNVSVAAGILCASLLRSNARPTSASKSVTVEPEKDSTDLF